MTTTTWPWSEAGTDPIVHEELRPVAGTGALGEATAVDVDQHRQGGARLLGAGEEVQATSTGE